jgi:hypothetical protein
LDHFLLEPVVGNEPVPFLVKQAGIDRGSDPVHTDDTKAIVTVV